MHYSLLLIFFTLATGYLLSGIFIILKDRNSSQNRKFFLLCLESALWAFGDAFMLISSSKASANNFRIIAALGWCFFASTWLDYAIDLCYGKAKKISWDRRILLYLPSIVFFINTMFHSPALVVAKSSFGYSEITPKNLVDNLYAVYYISFILISLLMVYRWSKRTKLNREKKQGRIIVFTGSIAAILGILSETVMPYLGNEYFQCAIIFMSIAMMGLWKAITKYKMMAVTPGYISDYIFKGVNNPIFFVNDHLELISVNDIAISTLGLTQNELDKSFFQRILDENNLSLDTLNGKGYVKNREIVYVRNDGVVLHFILSATIIDDDFKDRLGIVAILQDVSEQKEAERMLQNYNNELESKIAERTNRLENSNLVLQNEIQERISAEKKIIYMGYNDELTGLPNRRYFNEYITKQIEQVKLTNKSFAIMFMDIDDFKIVNDTEGHLCGDELLKQLAARMKDSIREGDLLARIGGDEFLILISSLEYNNNQLNYINHISDRIMSIFKEPVVINGKENFVTASIGVALYPKDGTDVETLIMNADIAMYEAKANRKNNVKICNDDIKNKVLENTRFRNDLYRAIEKDELVVYYQPQVEVNTKKIIGYEALLRWNYNKTSFISPKDFIPVAEETGLIVPIGYWVIKTVCSDLNKLDSVGEHNLCVAINLSKNQLMESDFVQKVLEILSENNLEPGSIEFEITERITLKDSAEINRKLEELKSYGFRISIDDFGTEYSSFMNLKHLPIDKIKIAMEFIQESTHNIKDAAIVKSIIDLSQNLNLKVIAEGVETHEQLEFIKKNGCNEV